MPTTKKRTEKKPAPQGHKALYIFLILALLATVLVLVNKLYSEKAESIFSFSSSDITGLELKKDSSGKIIIEENDTDNANKIAAKNDEKTQNTTTNDAKEMPKDINVKLYFIKPDGAGVRYVPVTRTVNESQKYENVARSLFKGPSTNEEKAGFSTAIAENSAIRSVRIENRIAVIDVNETILENTYGDFTKVMLNQIYISFTQFPEVQGITIKINGRVRNAFGHDGLVINWPMRSRL